MAIIGKQNTLTVVRDSSSGVYLDGGEHGEILVPNRYVPKRTIAGDDLSVFVYRDSEDRLVATTETPRAMVGDIATLRVISVNQRVGAFLDWGLAKDLLLPFREQTGPVREGDEVTVRVYLDPKTQRIVASMKLDESTQASREPKQARRTLQSGDSIEFLLTERTELGYKALVEGAHAGLLYHEGLGIRVAVGQKLKGFVRAVRPDGKVDLSLDQAGYQRVGPLTDQILKALGNAGGRLALDDDSSPEAVRRAFGVSKKAFKQALGALYKRRRIQFTKPGIEILDRVEWSPGEARPAKPKTHQNPPADRPRKVK